MEGIEERGQQQGVQQQARGVQQGVHHQRGQQQGVQQQARGVQQGVQQQRGQAQIDTSVHHSNALDPSALQTSDAHTSSSSHCDDITVGMLMYFAVGVVGYFWHSMATVQ